MSLWDAFRVAAGAIVSNRLRSALTSLGLIIGVSSVIVLIAVGQGTQQGVTDRIRGLGTDLLFIESSVAATTAQTGGLGGLAESTLSRSDADAIRAAARAAPTPPRAAFRRAPSAPRLRPPHHPPRRRPGRSPRRVAVESR